MKKYFYLLFLALTSLNLISCSVEEKTVQIQLAETSDVHGAFYDYDFRNGKVQHSSLSRISQYLKETRKELGDNLIYMDNGDILQGQPEVYFFNYMDTAKVHQVARMLNYLGCDATSVGNHDIETGHAVYDKFYGQCIFPVLGANIIDKKTGKPYFQPYKILERSGIKIAIIGMLTPAIPKWLPEILWEGLEFQDMVECAKQWIPEVKKEKPDLIVGLFHSGSDSREETAEGEVLEDASFVVPEKVPGFDIIFYGHDHKNRLEEIVDPEGKTVYCINPDNEAEFLSLAHVTFQLRNGKVVSKEIKPELKDMKDYPVDSDFEKEFAPQKQEAIDYINRKIGKLTKTLYAKEAFIGPCDFLSLIHQLQMDITGAPISITAPLSLNAVIPQGDLTVGDMFNLYRFENYLYTMSLTGQEIKDELEMSYASWTNIMKSANDDLLLLNKDASDDQHLGFKNFYFNFDTAAGINYTVDVTKPNGEKVNIISLSDGTPFDLTKRYNVAINSYRGNGGGDLLTKGAGLTKEEILKRIVKSTDKDLRYYLIKHIEEQKVVTPPHMNNWKFIPESWTIPAGKKNLKELFN